MKDIVEDTRKAAKMLENAVKTKVGSTEIQEALAECLERNQDSRLRGLW